jgi:hypothetical protein
LSFILFLNMTMSESLSWEFSGCKIELKLKLFFPFLDENLSSSSSGSGFRDGFGRKSH